MEKIDDGVVSAGGIQPRTARGPADGGFVGDSAQDVYREPLVGVPQANGIVYQCSTTTVLALVVLPVAASPLAAFAVFVGVEPYGVPMILALLVAAARDLFQVPDAAFPGQAVDFLRDRGIRSDGWVVETGLASDGGDLSALGAVQLVVRVPIF